MPRRIEEATVIYETPEGVATDTIESPKRVHGWKDELEIVEDRGNRQIEHSYGQDRVIKAEYEYEIVDEDQQEEGLEPALTDWKSVLVYVGSGLALGVIACLAYHNPTGQVAL